MTRVSVVIPNYNGRHLLPLCLDALSRQALPADEIIVVDDASTDGSPALIGEHYPECKVLPLLTNVGFCRAANAGLMAATGELLVLLNNDTEAHPEWLAELVATMEIHPTAGFCASKMLFSERRDYINSAGLFLRVDGVGRDIGYSELDGPEHNVMREVFGASGGAALYRRTMLDDVGLLDEDLDAYAEDLDLSFRAQLRGWSCVYAPTAIVYHRVGATFGLESSRKVYYSSRNMLMNVMKNMPAGVLRRHWLQIVMAQVYQVVYYCLRGQGWPSVRGKAAALANAHKTLSKRRAIQRARRVPDAHIEALLDSWGTRGRLEHLSCESRVAR